MLIGECHLNFVSQYIIVIGLEFRLELLPRIPSEISGETVDANGPASPGNFKFMVSELCCKFHDVLVVVPRKLTSYTATTYRF